MPHIAVLGAGVIGLSTAIRILESGQEVTIIAEYFPGDKTSIEYTSLWASALHASYSRNDPLTRGINRETFKVMREMAEDKHPARGCFMWITQQDHFLGLDEQRAQLDVELDLRQLSREELIAPADAGYSFTTLTIDPASYLLYLYSMFLEMGGTAVRSKVMHISQVAQGAFMTTQPDAVIICAGIGARNLGGVEDLDVYPVRGQVVVILAPWIKSGCVLRTADNFTYVIPRSSGAVALGGTQDANDWYPHARPETTNKIIARALAMFPEIAPPGLRANGRIPTVGDVKTIMVEEGYGLRPARKGGVRIEVGSVEWLDGQSKRLTPLVFNYGHGAGGYQGSWGAATQAVGLLNKVLAKDTK